MKNSLFLFLIFFGFSSLFSGCESEKKISSENSSSNTSLSGSSPKSHSDVMENALFICYAGSAFIGTETRITSKINDSIEVKDISSLQMNRSGNIVSATVTHFEKLSHSGELLLFSTEVAMGGAPTRYEAVLPPISDDGTLAFPVSISCRGMKQTQNLTLRLQSPQPLRGAYAMETSFILSPLKPGESRTFIRFNPTLLQWETITANCPRVENITLPTGETCPLSRIETSARLLNPDGTQAAQELQKEFIWCDGNGLVWKRFSPLMNLSSWRTTPKLLEKYQKSGQFPPAPDSSETASSPSNLAETLHVPVRFMTSAASLANASEVTYRVSSSNSSAPAPIRGLFCSSDFQKVETIDDFTLRITVRNSSYAPFNQNSGSTRVPNDEEKLPSPIIQSSAPRIIQLASSVLPTETDTQKIAHALRSFVFRFIQNKNYARGFVTALEVAEDPSGDCTEHAVLLAALARARNIPARIAQGLLFDPQSGKMAWHVWNELFLNGRWVAMDATIDQNFLSPAHIQINSGSFSAASMAQTLLPPAKLIGKIEITVETVQ